jgi:flavin reductase (DIM6/NTAB) family NADH-FMN oxidoreductase RutF
VRASSASFAFFFSDLPTMTTTSQTADQVPETLALPVEDFTPGEMYFLLRDSILPRPIAWVSTVDEAGVSNLAPFSFFNVCCPSPPVLGFSCGPRGDDHGSAKHEVKDTMHNIRSTGEFVVNVSPEGLFEPMVDSAQPLPPGVSEFEALGIASAPSDIVKPPRVLHSPISFECKLRDILPLGANQWIMGDVVRIHIQKAVYRGEREGKRHRVDLLEDPATRPVGRLGRAFYSRLSDVMLRQRKGGPN